MLRNVVLFFALLGTSTFAVEDKPYYLEEHCQQLNDLIIDETVKIRLALANETTAESCKTQLGFQAREDVFLLVTISAVNLSKAEPSGMCLKHFLQINGLSHNGPDQQRFCENQPGRFSHIFLTTDKETDKHIYYFRSVPLHKNHTLELTVSAVTYPDSHGGCPSLSSEPNATRPFMCERDGLCIPAALRCDDVPNCPDQSDERNCIGTTVPTTTPSTTTVTSANPSVDPLARDVAGSGNSRKPHIIIGITGGVVILILVAVVAIFIVRRRSHYHSVTTTEVVQQPTQQREDDSPLNTSLKKPEDSSV